MDYADPRALLARRLRALREERWPDLKITQSQLAHALGGDKPLSVPLISSWEKQAGPAIPPLARLEGYAALFATRRSFEGDAPRLIRPIDMTDGERREFGEIKQELAQLRAHAMRAGSGSGGISGTETDHLSRLAGSLNTGPWRFADGDTVTLVCAQFPKNLRAAEKYTDRNSPDYIELYNYSELDALFELFGHLRAANPVSQIDLRLTDGLPRDAHSSHLVTLGGIDWNATTASVLNRLSLPVEQFADWGEDDAESEDGIESEEGAEHEDGAEDDVYFEVEEEGGRKIQHRPEFADISGRRELVSDVALFARARNPFNKERTVTICNGMYGRGTYGAVRALTDARFRERNAEYVQSRFGGSDSYCILTRVPVVNGATMTPDWTVDEIKLFEWSRGRDGRN
jgi:hypothetical protein